MTPSHLASSRTRVRIPLRTFILKEMLARASYYKHVSLGPQDLDRSLGRLVRPYTETRQPIRPKDPAVSGEGECHKAYPRPGNRSIFYPGSSVGNTITFVIVEDTSSNPTSVLGFFLVPPSLLSAGPVVSPVDRSPVPRQHRYVPGPCYGLYFAES